MHNAPTSSTVVGSICQGEVVEASLIGSDSCWAQLVPSEALRLANESSSLIYICTAKGVRTFGGRHESSGELWFRRSALGCVVKPCTTKQQVPRWPMSVNKRLKSMDGRKVEVAPPLRALETTLTEDAIARLVDRGYVVVDHALPAALCRKLKAEMQALEDNGQMWNSRSYGNADEGSAHKHINETQLDYKEVPKYAPTFARIEHDPSLIDQLRGVPGLEHLSSQHVRIQINEGRGGCYTMHTDQGTTESSSGQTLHVTALFYLNDDWQPGDGGELRIFPYPHPAESIPPLQGRLVLFEPRMVHDVLPCFRKRFCFTLWCGVRGGATSRQIDHETLRRLELATSLSDSAAIAESWRARQGHKLAYDRQLPPVMRPLFLAEMRMCVVRVVHGEEELRGTALSHEVWAFSSCLSPAAHALVAWLPRPCTLLARFFLRPLALPADPGLLALAGLSRLTRSLGSCLGCPLPQGETKEVMIDGIQRHHAKIRHDNPAWVLELMRQLPAASVEGARAAGAAEDVISLNELRDLAHLSGPWWI